MSNSQRYLKKSIREWLSFLRRELGHYDQTTHGSMIPTGCGIGLVVDAITKCYEDPTPFNISELNQRIDKFLVDSAQ